jgi:hypothetical protein
MTKHPYAKLVKYPSSEILDYTIEELVNDSDDISFYLPYQWSKGDGIGNRRPKDPLTIYWSAHVNGLEDRVTYKTTLGAMLDDTFELHERWHEKPPAIGSTSVPLFTNIRDALQKEVDRLTMWIDNAKPEGKDNG